MNDIWKTWMYRWISVEVDTDKDNAETFLMHLFSHILWRIEYKGESHPFEPNLYPFNF